MLKKSIKVLTIIFILVFAINLVKNYTGSGNVALIKINGIITDSKTARWIKEIHKAQKDNAYKAIFLKINSPGGSANASERLYLAIKNADKIKPVIALISDIGASGAYYAACGARKIVAYPTSVVGSIGVLFESVNVSELAKRLGVSSFVIKSGKVKDAGNPLRKPTQADINMLQNVVNGIYEQFLSDVANSRHIKKDVLKKYADGSVFYAKEALAIGLIDKVGSEQTAKDLLKKEAHIKNISFSRMREEEGLLNELLGSKFAFFIDYLKFKFSPAAKAIFYD